MFEGDVMRRKKKKKYVFIKLCCRWVSRVPHCIGLLVYALDLRRNSVRASIPLCVPRVHEHFEYFIHTQYFSTLPAYPKAADSLHVQFPSEHHPLTVN